MNLFRPYRNDEPQRDERGRLMGIDRYQDVPGRNWKRFFLSGLMAIPCCLPLTLGVTYTILSSSILVLLPAALIGGGVAGPFIACLYDTVLRALRDAPGRWSANYRKALAQNWRTTLLQPAWRLLMVLFAPWTLLLFPFVGVWFDLFAALFLLYDRLDKALGIEESIALAFPDQVPRYDR